jgi:hypothetical protein
MKFFTASALLAGALLSGVSVIPFLPAASKMTERFDLEIKLISSAAGHLQLYYDRGTGFKETDSFLVPVVAGSEYHTYRLALPPGTYRNLRFDPLDRDGAIAIESARIVDGRGGELRNIGLDQFTPLNQIQLLSNADGRLEVVTVPGGNDPQLLINFNSPLQLRESWTLAVGEWASRAAVVWALLAIILWAADRWVAARNGAVTGAHWAMANPGRAMAIVGAVAVIVSSYPVIFLGKSYVSPNFGKDPRQAQEGPASVVTLLYDGFPTLPGYGQEQVSNVQGADVGAIMWQHIPFSMIQHRALFRDAEFPLWNRYESTGSPLLGQGQSMFGDPLHFFVIAANGAAWAWDLKYLCAKWLFSFGLGLIVLAATRHCPSALLIGFGAPFVGFFVYRVNHPAFFSLCYAPWPLFCWIRAAQAVTGRATARWLAGLVLANVALLSSGTVKEAYMLLLTINFSGLCVVLTDIAPWKVRLAKMAGAAWAGIIFILVAAPLWGTFLITLRGAYTSYDAVSAFQIQPGMLLGAFDEAFYRPLSRGELVFNPSANFLILAGLLYFLATLRHHFANRAVIILAAASLLPFSMAFGLVPPSWIVRLPFLANVAHIDNCFTCGLIILWAVLAGAGFAAAARRLGESEGRDDLVGAALMLFALVFGFVAFGQAVHRSVFGPGITFSPLDPGQSMTTSPFVWGYLATLLLGTIGGGLIARHALQRRRLSPAAGLMLVVCIAALLWRQGLQAGSGFPDYVVHPPIRANFQALSAAVDFIQRGQRKEPARSIGLKNNLFPGWSAVYGIEGVSGPDALINPYYRELTTASPLQRIWDWRLYLSRDNVAPSRPFLDFLNVRYYLDLKSNQAVLGAVLKPDRMGDLDVYESPTAWPRAFFTDRIGYYEKPEQFVQQILQGDGKPFAATLPTEVAAFPTLASLPDDQPSRTIVPATRYKLTEDTTSFDIQAPTAGLVVLTEAFWPAYSHAEIDGHTVPVVRINHAFEGVAVDSEGIHHVSFHYRPRHFFFLLELSAAGLVLAAASLGLVRRLTRGEAIQPVLVLI